MFLRQIQDLLADHLPSFLEIREAEKRPVPWVVERDIKLFLTCGDPAFGYAHLVCSWCPFELKLVSSCKRRSMCPRCIRRRRDDRVPHLVDNVLPDVPIRHWVESLPAYLRFILASYPELSSGALKCFVDSIFEYLQWKAKDELGLRSVEMAHPGGVAVPHPVSANLNTNPHYHCLAPEGVHVQLTPGGPVEFHTVSAPTPDEIANVAARACERTLKLLARKGRWVPSDESPPNGFQGTLSLSVPQLVTFYGKAVGTGEPESIAVVGGQPFDVFAGSCVQQGDRMGLKRLVLYLLSPPFNESQLRLHSDGRIVLTLKRPRHDGRTEEWFTVYEFLEALLVMIPKPRSHTLRYFGNLGPNSSIRKQIVKQNKGHERSPNADAADEEKSIPEHSPTPNDAVQEEPVSEREALRHLNVRCHREDFLRCPVCLDKLQLAVLTTHKFTYRNPRWIPPDIPIDVTQAEFKTGSSPIPPVDVARTSTSKSAVYPAIEHISSTAETSVWSVTPGRLTNR